MEVSKPLRHLSVRSGHQKPLKIFRVASIVLTKNILGVELRQYSYRHIMKYENS